MNRNFHRMTLLAVALSGASLAAAQSATGLDHRNAHVARAEGGASLTPANSHASARSIVAAYLGNRGRSADVQDSLSVTGSSDGAHGVTHVRMEQRIDGVAVYGAYVKAAINAKGELVHVIDRVYDVGMARPSRIDESQALSATLAHLYPSLKAEIKAADAHGNSTSFDAGSFFWRKPVVTAVNLPMEDGTLERGWVVQTWTAKTNQLHYTVVDGGGRVLEDESRTNNDRYNVYVEDPVKTPQAVVNGGGAGSPNGWLGAVTQTTVNITGNNTHTYLDTDANNSADSGGSTVNNGDFLTAADLTTTPSGTGNKAVAVQNLFYLTNRMHDVLYGYGFNEANGNFQKDNFGLGGAGNDPVNAEAQDGSGLDNANFSTPNDGSAPRMQMYLWSGSTPTGLVTVGSTDYGAFGSSFGPALTALGVSGPLAVMNDGTGTASDGCESAKTALTGKVAIVDRGICNFTIKVQNAQNAGAKAVVIVNNDGGIAFAPGGTATKIKIPSGMVTLADGNALKTLVGSTGNLRKNPAPPLRLDGDLDSDIVFHEYGHGLTWRMIGSMSGPLAGAIGEGASDVNAFLINGDDRIGEYAYGDPLGIRRSPYGSYTLTYKDVTGAEVHDDGEIYAAAMWRVLQNYLGKGLTAADLHKDFVDGMNYTPSAPAYENMRDGMLQSVGTASVRGCAIWKGFAATGIGVGAKGTVSRRGTVSITESTTVPAACLP